MAEFNMDQFEQDYRNERRKALRDSVESGKTSFPVGILQHGSNRIGEGFSDTAQGIGSFAKSLYNNPQAVAESGAEGLEALYNRVAQEDPMAAMEVAGMVATGGATTAVAKGARLADFATFDPNTSRMFIGAIGAKNLADAGKPVAEKVLKVARQMRRMGASEAEIRAKTNRIIGNEDPSLGGVSLNANGQLVVEIDDSKMALRSDSAGGTYFSTDIDNVLEGTLLGKAYPKEINMKVSDVSEAPRENVLGSFDENTNTITSFALKTDVPGVTAHELQHFIQAREGFPRGGNEIDALDGMYGNMANDYDEISTLLRQFNGKPIPKNVYQQFENPEIMRASLLKIRRDYEGDDDAAADFAENQAITIRDDPEDWAKTIYSYLAGEVEARNVQTRLKMTPAERRATPPQETETDARFKMPLAREEQIISKRAQGGEVMQGVGSLNETARNMFRGGPVYMSNGGDSALNNASFEALLSAVIQTESGGDPNAVSEDDAIGLMQVLPSTAVQPGYEQYGAENVFDIAERLIGYDGDRSETDARKLLFNPKVNVEFGTKYLKAMIETTGGDIYGALQKYNAGPGNYANFEDDPVKNPLDQEAVRYPGLVISALGLDPEGMFRQTGSRPFAAPREADPFVSTQGTEFDDFQPMLPTIGTPPPADAPLAVEELMKQGAVPPEQRDTTGIFDKYLERREEFMREEEGLVRPRLRPLGDGLTRSLRPRLRPEPPKPYGGSNPQGLMDGIESLRDRTFRRGFTPYAEDVRGELI